jgi:hypothetical protein
MEKFLNPNDPNTVTPETLAWKLIMDDTFKDFEGLLIPFVNSPNSPDIPTIPLHSNTNRLYEQLSDQFQILITIYMEMIFYVLKINHIMEHLDESKSDELNDSDSNDIEASFKPDLSNFALDDLTNTFREKFKKIRIFLSVRTIQNTNMDNPRDFGSESAYYCRIIMKDTTYGMSYFASNISQIDPSKRYTFVIRNDKTQRKLDDFYAVCALPNMKVRISFSQINQQ